ncbi:MAG: undecaprenyl-phosphate galactose phosphotransferase WbaP [Rubrobacter sp.]|nr:undecaprenyl-phosphate galactose phosphotransferase WbaP [Rubrobacter sp.]
MSSARKESGAASSGRDPGHNDNRKIARDRGYVRNTAERQAQTKQEEYPVLPGVPRGKRAQDRRQRLVILLLILSDVLLAALVWQGASVVQSIWGRTEISGVAAFSILPNIMIWIGLRALMGLYPGYGFHAPEELRRQTYAVASALAVTIVFAVALHVGDLLSRLLVFGGFAGLALLAPLVRHFVRRGIMRLGLWGKPVVILGVGETGERVVAALLKERGLGFVPAAVFDDRAPAGANVHGVSYGGTLEDAGGISLLYGIDTAIVAMPPASRSRLGEIIDWAGLLFRRVVVVPELGEVTNSTVVARDLAGVFGVEIKQNLLNPSSRRAKRSLDLFGAVAGGLVISPLLLALAVLVKLDSPGPAFYGQHRQGTGGETFRCWKFRTMCLDAEKALDEYLQDDPVLWAEWEHDQKLREDPRITSIGRFLRRTSLDELPQLWNVLWGEMSLVGPRPIVEAEIPRYDAMYDLYLRVTPGISGLWQVSGRNDTSYEERVTLDAYYVRNWSVWLDLVILARTLTAVIYGHGAR